MSEKEWEDYEKYTEKRPRLREETVKILERLESKVEHEVEDRDEKTRYENNHGKVSSDRVIREALKALEERGLEI